MLEGCTLAVGVVAAFGVACGTVGATAPTPAATGASALPETGWAASNGDLANTRVAASSISSANVARLRLAWTAPLTGVGGDGYRYAATPLISGGVVFTQDLASTVTAYAEKDGTVIWRHTFPNAPSEGPNGVTLGDGRIYGATETYAFALDQATGKLLWRSRTLVRNGHEGIDMAPAVNDGLVDISTVPGNTTAFYAGGGAGTLFALAAATGQVRWSFHTVPVGLWGDPSDNSGGGLWYAPALGADGSLYADIANPAPFPDGSTRPGPNLYTDSMVKLSARTGKLQWYRQMLPHDIYDWDLQDPPVLTQVGGRTIAVAAGKMGYVYAVDATSGKLLWKTAVGLHNGHDGDGESAGAGTVPKGTVYPGSYGGVLTPIAVAGGTAYVPVVDLGTDWAGETQLWDSAGGEVAAVDLETGAIRWQTKVGQPVFGAATVSNDLVFTTTFDGRLLALDRSSGRVAWSRKLSTGTNAPVAIDGNLLITAASIPHGNAQPELMAFRLPSS